MRAEAVLGGPFLRLPAFNPLSASALCDFFRVTGKSVTWRYKASESGGRRQSSRAFSQNPHNPHNPHIVFRFWAIPDAFWYFMVPTRAPLAAGHL
jgi:hypothetical protein